MKIAVFADFHGSTAALQTAAEICKRERPDKTVICGDLFGWSSSPVAVAELLSKLDGVLYLVRGNNDYVLVGRDRDSLKSRKRHNLEKGYAFFMDLAIRCNLFRYSGFEYAEPYVHRFALFCKR